MLNRPESADAETSAALQRDLVLLDLETTGTSAANDRIIEIGLVHFSRFRIVDQWSTLVNPEVSLSRFIEDYTGITGEKLASAPRFAEIAGKLRRHLERGLLVAHNARFDYGFLQSEFSRIWLSTSLQLRH